MKKIIRFAVLALSGAFAGCEDAATVTLRVTLDVEANGTPYSSSTVVNMRYSTGYTFLKSSGYTTVVSFGRHAPYVRIGQDRVLFLPFNGGSLPQLGLRDVIHKAYGLANSTSQNSSMSEHLKPIIKSRSGVNYPLEDRMTPKIAFIYLQDRLIPSAARRMTVNDLVAEHNITVKAIRFQATNETVTNTISTVVPWIDIQNRNQRIYTRLPDKNEFGDDLINIYAYNLVGKL